MKHKGGQRNKKKFMSLCEKSMVLVANIIKLSSLSLANNCFGATSSVRSLEPAHDCKMTKVDVPHCQNSSPKRSQEPENESKPFYVMMQVPITEDQSSSSSYAGVDGKAEDFIRRIRDKIHKNQNDQQHVLG
ncbi:hypothetical protein ACE6H2_002769 [Prunus campanulata]